MDMKKQLQQLQAPAELEQRLTAALAKQPRRTVKTRYPLLIAAVVMLLFCSYNFNALAYYSKQFFGYEKVLSENLQQLHAEGYGQTLNETITLKNGAVITIEGLMADSNQLLLYYKEQGAHVAEQTSATLLHISSRFQKYQASGGYGYSSEPNTYHFVATFEAVSGFSKKLTLVLQDHELNRYEVPLRYNANDALPTMLKQKINETYAFNNQSFTLKQLVITPNSTMLTGKSTGLIDTASIKLIVDGVPFTQQSSSSLSIREKSSFEILWASVPADAKLLEIQINGHTTYTLPIQ